MVATRIVVTMVTVYGCDSSHVVTRDAGTMVCMYTYPIGGLTDQNKLYGKSRGGPIYRRSP